MDNIDEETLLNAISRAGYLLEAKVAETFSKMGLFVESNIMIEDPLSGKSREIDLLAEFDLIFRDNPDYTSASINFICEVKNNPYPFVLLSKFQNSPHTDIWDSIKNMVTLPNTIKNQDRYSLLHELDFYDYLIADKLDKIFTQYCSFQPKKNTDKKNELMAWHPDFLYDSLSKITFYCEKTIESWEYKGSDKYFRDFLYMPVLIIRDNLYELELSQNGATQKLNKVDYSYLLHNYHYNSEPKFATVFVVTFEGLPNFIKEMSNVREIVEKNLIDLRKNNKYT